MVIERAIPRIDQITSPQERILGNKDNLGILLRNDRQKKNEIIKKIVSDLGNDIVAQVSFLELLFQNLAEEGDSKITDRREASMAILTDTSLIGEVRLNTAIAPLVKRNFKVVHDAYIQAVKKQDNTHDPVSGSIVTLSVLGRVIVSHSNQTPQGIGELISAWEELRNKGRFERHQQLQIGSQIENIKAAIPIDLLEPQAKENSPNGGIAREEKGSRLKRKIDDETMIRFREEVVRLRNNGKENIEIAETLGIRRLDVEYIIRKLLREKKPRIKPRSKGRAVTQKTVDFDMKVEGLRKQEWTNTQIAEHFKIDRKLVEESAGRLLKKGRILRASRGRGKTIERLAS